MIRPKRQILPVLLFLLTALLCPVLGQETPSAPAQEKAPDVETVLRRLEDLTEVKRLRPVASRKMTRDQVMAYIAKLMDQEIPPARISEEQRILIALGMLPPGTDLRQSYLGLLREQVGGFYDSRTGTYVVADWIPASFQAPVMAHELFHALQDQHVSLEPIRKKLKGDEDASLALSAALEGGATVAMISYIAGLPASSLTNLPAMGSLMGSLSGAATAGMPNFSSAPPYLQESLMFPYAFGTDFALTAMRKGSFAATVDILKKPPTTSEQILHPEKYFGREPEPAIPVSIQKKDWGGQGKPATKPRHMGEFALGQFLRVGLRRDRADEAASGWGGDELLLLSRTGKSDAVIWKTIWDTPEFAARFRKALGEWSPEEGKPRIRILQSDSTLVLFLVEPAGARP